MPVESRDNGNRIEYVLNFIHTTAHKKFNQWKPVGATLVDLTSAKKCTEVFLNYLVSNMDHNVSQGCLVYQLKNICMHPRGTHDELVECISVLVDQWNFPTNDEKEWHVQFWFVHALGDRDVIKKLLALDLTVSTAKILEVCCMHITIVDNLNAMDLTGSKSLGEVGKQCPHQPVSLKPMLLVLPNTHVAISASHMHLAESPAF